LADGDSRARRAPLVGLDDRPRPDNARERILRGLSQSAPFSSLQRRIIFLNLAGLALLVAGALYLNQFRAGLIDQRLEALGTLGKVIATTLGDSANIDPGEPGYDPAAANRILGRLAEPAGLRARLYDARMRLIGDTRRTDPAEAEAATARAEAERMEAERDTIGRIALAVSEAFDDLGSLLSSQGSIPYSEPEQPGISRQEIVRDAATGTLSSTVRLNEAEQLIVSVGPPIPREDRIIGVLVLSTVGDDINQVVRAERAAILQMFIIAAAVSIGLSIVLANTIAKPIQRLAEAADSEGTNAARPLNPERVEIPDLTHRTDEIGELSAALNRMTEALYKRIEAIESFASDVAHEIKNPLTSLRSAVETMALAKTPEQRQRLLDVIQKDVSRMDRLVTDISNASRLDADLVRERMETFDLGSLCEMLMRIFSDQGEARGVTVAMQLPEGRLEARGLEGRIAQVITNFLDNALSFSDDGSTVTLFVRRLDNGGVRVWVEDEGPGVPPDNMESVFERFYSERPDREEFGNHSGLGLAISRQIIEAHGGRIWCENRPDPDGGPDAPPLGARFLFELPA